MPGCLKHLCFGFWTEKQEQVRVLPSGAVAARGRRWRERGGYINFARTRSSRGN